MCRQARKLIRWGCWLCLGLLTYTLIYLLRLPAVGSYSILQQAVSQLLQTAFVSGLILCFAAAVAELLNRG